MRAETASGGKSKRMWAEDQIQKITREGARSTQPERPDALLDVSSGTYNILP